MKHTPDEWYVEEDSAGRPGVRNRSGFVSFSPSVIHYTGQSERYKAELDERLARAQLIAASPDLLEALKDIVFIAYTRNIKYTHNFYETHPDILEKAEKAIVKAEGKA